MMDKIVAPCGSSAKWMPKLKIWRVVEVAPWGLTERVARSVDINKFTSNGPGWPGVYSYNTISRVVEITRRGPKPHKEFNRTSAIKEVLANC